MDGLSGEQLRAEFLEELGRRADEHFKGKLHQAFVAWFVEAEYGDVEWHFTDDACDGGIDAVVVLPFEVPSVVVLQSKFSQRVEGAPLAVSAYEDLERVVHAFRYGGQYFQEFQDGVRSDLRIRYRKTFDAVQNAGRWTLGKKAFRLITTHKRRRECEFEGVDCECFIYGKDILELYRQYRRVACPPAKPLSLTVGGATLPYRDPSRNVHSILFNAHVADFRKYFDHCDVARLVARNIRLNLGKKIGRMIRQTYEEHPHDFWYFHNGITIVCDGMHVRNGVVTLDRPSVVNGAQTLYAICESNCRSSRALVTTKVVVRERTKDVAVDDDEWIQSIIRCVNTQNKVEAADFRSNEPEQIELQKLFRSVGVFYERKRGQWREFRNESQYRGFISLSSRLFANLMTAVSDRDGKGVVLLKRGSEKVFAEENYRSLFPSRKLVERRFERFYLAYRIYRLLNMHGYSDMRTYRRHHHGFWNCVWLMHRGVYALPRLHSQATVHSVRESFDRFEDVGTQAGRQARKTCREVTRTAWAAFRRGRRKDVDYWTANNFFKMDYGSECLVRFALPKLRTRLKSLAREIVV